jgi:hypothetical protein
MKLDREVEMLKREEE